MHRFHVAWTALLAGCLSPPLRRDFERLEADIGESARKQQQEPAAAPAPLPSGNAARGGDDPLVAPLDLALLIEEALRRIRQALAAGG